MLPETAGKFFRFSATIGTNPSKFSAIAGQRVFGMFSLPLILLLISVAA